MWFLWRTARLLENQREILNQLCRLRRDQLILVKKIDFLERVIDNWKRAKLGPVGYTITSERIEKNMADTIKFNVNLPPKAAPDVVSRELTVVVNDGLPDVRTLSADTVVVDGFEGPQDTMVHVSLVDVDDGGNRSEASTVSFILVDLVPPPMPGELGVAVVDEKFE